jgi:hypothetical protein
LTDKERFEDDSFNTEDGDLTSEDSLKGKKKIVNNLSVFQKIGAFVGDLLGVNEASFGEIRESLRMALKIESPSDWFYISESDLYEDYFVYEHETRNKTPAGIMTMPVDGKTKHYKRSYAVDSAGNVTLAAEKTEVRRVMKYEPIIPPKTNEENQETNPVPDKPNTNTKEDKALNKKELIDSLIANEKTILTETDREWLDKLEVNQLEKMIPKAEEKPPATQSAQTETKQEAKTEQPAVNSKPQTTEEWLAAAPSEIREVFVNSLNDEKKRRDKMIETLTANAQCAFSKEELQAFNAVQLERLCDSLAVNNYSGKGGPRGNRKPENDEYSVPDPPPIVLAKNEVKK